MGNCVGNNKKILYNASLRYSLIITPEKEIHLMEYHFAEWMRDMMDKIIHIDETIFIQPFQACLLEPEITGAAPEIQTKYIYIMKVFSRENNEEGEIMFFVCYELDYPGDIRKLILHKVVDESDYTLFCLDKSKLDGCFFNIFIVFDDKKINPDVFGKNLEIKDNIDKRKRMIIKKDKLIEGQYIKSFEEYTKNLVIEYLKKTKK